MRPYVACVGLVSLGASAGFRAEARRPFAPCTLAVVPLIGGVPCGGQSPRWVRGWASPSLCSRHRPVGQGLPPLLARRPPGAWLSCVSEPPRAEAGTGALPLGEQPLSFLAGAAVAPFMCQGAQTHCYWHCPRLRRSRGNASRGPGVPGVLSSQDRSTHASESSVGAVEASHPRASPSPHARVPTEPTAAEARAPSGRSICCLFVCPTGAEFTELPVEV